MLRFFRHQLGEVEVSSGTDRVVAFMPLASECSQNNVWGKVHVIAQDVEFISDVSLYGIDGFVLPMPDPDTPDSVDDLWDRLIDKDDDLTAGALDLDETAADTDNLYEAGEPSLGNILDMHLYKDDNHWFKRRGLMSFATSPTGFNWVDSNLSTYHPRDFFKIRARKKIFTEFFSISLLGVSVPTVITTSTVGMSPANRAQWMQQKYLEVVLEQAWMSLVGLTETGAETPWEDAALYVQELLEPDPYEQNTGAFQTLSSLRVFAETTWDLSVPGRREFKILSGN